MLRSIEDGARALLEDAVSALSEFGESEHVVVGGWCPVYRNKNGPKHPGTLDVDILSRKSDTDGYLSDFMKLLMARGFYPSAKHPFQYLKVQEVSGTKFVYNIDLLHPRMTEDIEKIGMYVDHLELNVPLSSDEIALKKMMSIALPNSDVLFRENLFTQESIGNTSFNLVSFLGMFLTKIDSCQKQKRERDSFDIYLALINEQVDWDRVSDIQKRDSRICESLQKFVKHLKEKGSEFDRNVSSYCAPKHDSPSEFILSHVNG